ncbi:hypothetical protein ACFVU2_19090 [Leifsonia sp. NPDC058194]|uniref:hypothetical protein n=1 Tax=Leifsonia sp. NPDC058194 TaxID=3346374 RepID=UPI0036DE3F67
MNGDQWATFFITLAATAAGAVVGVVGVWLVSVVEGRGRYSQALDRAVAEISIAIAARSDALLDREDAANDIYSAPSGSPEQMDEEVEALPAVRSGALTSAVEVFILTTKRGRDRRVSAALRSAVATATTRGGRHESQSLLASSTALVEWRAKIRPRRAAIRDLEMQAEGR